MAAVIRQGDLVKHDDNSTNPITPSTNTTVFANSIPITVNQDPVVPHKIGTHQSSKMVAACKNVFIGGKKVVIVGNAATCGALAIGGSSNVNVGNA
jgi:uncharacterized Zn-binding protein involved in type VI secretion